jgi:hypothetical protein
MEVEETGVEPHFARPPQAKGLPYKKKYLKNKNLIDFYPYFLKNL